MTVGAALRKALQETYRCSWRLVVVNTVLSATVIGVVLVVSTVPLALLLAPTIAGPAAAALVHCTLVLRDEEEFRLADAVEGVRLHWKRGLALGALFGAGLMLGFLGVTFYASPGHRSWLLAALALYLLALFCLVVLMAWPLAIAEPEQELPEAVQQAFVLLLRNPLRVLTLGAALLVVNVLAAVTVLPLLTLAIGYSFLTAAHVALPFPSTREEVAPRWQA